MLLEASHGNQEQIMMVTLSYETIIHQKWVKHFKMWLKLQISYYAPPMLLCILFVPMHSLCPSCAPMHPHSPSYIPSMQPQCPMLYTHIHPYALPYVPSYPTCTLLYPFYNLTSSKSTEQMQVISKICLYTLNSYSSP